MERDGTGRVGSWFSDSAAFNAACVDCPPEQRFVFLVLLWRLADKKILFQVSCPPGDLKGPMGVQSAAYFSNGFGRSRSS